MAVCNLNEITISGADGFPNANGVYINTGENVYDNIPAGALLIYSPSGNFGAGWYIFSGGIRYFAAQAVADCPTGLTFDGVEGIEGSFVLGGASPIMIGIRTLAEQIRLRLLGYI